MNPFLFFIGNALVGGVLGGVVSYFAAMSSAERDIRKRYGYSHQQWKALKAKWAQEDKSAGRVLAGKEKNE